VRRIPPDAFAVYHIKAMTSRSGSYYGRNPETHGLPTLPELASAFVFRVVTADSYCPNSLEIVAPLTYTVDRMRAIAHADPSSLSYWKYLLKRCSVAGDFGSNTILHDLAVAFHSDNIESQYRLVHLSCSHLFIRKLPDLLAARYARGDDLL
jgi:hypothetical protein